MENSGNWIQKAIAAILIMAFRKNNIKSIQSKILRRATETALL